MHLLIKIDEAARNWERTGDEKYKKEWYELIKMIPLKPVIEPIFPTPLYRSMLKNSVTDAQVDYVFKLDTNKNLNNKTSANTFILNEDVFKSLKDELQIMLKDYYKQVIGRDDLEPYITQSWVNFTDPGESHHLHSHRNSIVSGVVFLQADKDYDKITFCRDNLKVFDFIGKPNIYNFEEVDVPAGKDFVILFPSDLRHKVKKTKYIKTRVSLSFNSFIKGFLGKTSDLTELKI
jgi:uncharacterized protein (TIGR02466 family)